MQTLELIAGVLYFVFVVIAAKEMCKATEEKDLHSLLYYGLLLLALVIYRTRR